METTILGAANPYQIADVISRPTPYGGGWAFSPQFNGRKLIRSVRISLTGSRRRDYARACSQSGKSHTPRQTVWHHVYDYTPAGDRCTMQLVRWNHHLRTIPHVGGCKAYTVQHGIPYHLTPAEPETPVCLIPSYTSRELEEFSLRTGFPLTPELRRFYSGDFQLRQSALVMAAKEDFTLDAILPLYDKEDASMEGVHTVLKELSDFSLKKGLQAIGIGPCGDIFYTDQRGQIWFHDHESDEYLDTGLDLKTLTE